MGRGRLKVHFVYNKDKIAACGYITVSKDELTRVVNKVTCQRCLQSRILRLLKENN